MSKIGTFILLAAVSLALSGCGAPPANTNSNGSTTNTNANKTTAAAPTAEMLLDMDKKANEAYFKGDSKYFEGMLSDKFAMVFGGHRFDKATMVKMIGETRCEVKDLKLEEPQMSMIDADTYAMVYKTTTDGTCTENGKASKIPSPVRAASVWVRNGDKWQGAFHGENVIIDPKMPPPPPPPPADKKETPKTDDKIASNSNSNSAPAAPSGPAKSANTDALVAVEKSGWEAWKAKDAKKLDEITAKSLSIVSADGRWMNRVDTLKFWAEMPCENVKTVDVKDGYGIALSPNVEMLTFVGHSDGTCFGQKNVPQDGMSVYVKENGAWKLAFSFMAIGSM